MGATISIITVRELAGDEIDLMKSWVSEPVVSHFVHVKGTNALKSPAQQKKVIADTVVHTCPRAVSPVGC
jgi:hypothetical protein